MNKKLGRALYMQVRIYFVLLSVFVLAAAVLQQYLLAAVGGVLVAVALTVYLLQKRNRTKEIQQQSTAEEIRSKYGTVRLCKRSIFRCN